MPRIPGDPGRTTRPNRASKGWTTLVFKPAKQPRLPSCVDWCEQTRKWWKMWGQSPQAAMFCATDWDFLLDTALVHNAVWTGDLKHAGELRLREQKFGVTAPDRARAHMSFGIPAADTDTGATDQPPASRKRYSNLRSIRSEPPPAS